MPWNQFLKQRKEEILATTQSQTLVLDDDRFSFGDFDALSYAWGSPQNPKIVIVNGETFQINENLESFLRQVASENIYSDRLGLWVDSICIQQTNIPERNEHIKMMAKIYSLAMNVVSWLGKEADDSHKAIDLLNVLGPLNDPKKIQPLLFKKSKSLVRRYASGKAILRMESGGRWFSYYLGPTLGDCGSSKRSFLEKTA